MSGDLLRKYINVINENLKPTTSSDSAQRLDEKYVGFEKLEKEIAKRPGVRDPGAVAASIGRKKYGKERFQKAAAAGRKLGEDEQIDEKWGTPTKVSPEEKGKYAGKTKAELLKSYNALKARGPHKKGSPEYGRMRELAFAIRAKTGWGKVKDE